MRLTVFGLIGALVLLDLAGVTRTWRRVHSHVAPSQFQSVPPRTRPGAPELQYLLKAHLFGGSGPPPPSATPPINSVLKLVGTIAGPSSAAGMAIIGLSTNVVHLYAVRDTVAAGVILGAVYPDRVILLRGEAQEVLWLPGLAAAGRDSRVASVRARAQQMARDDETPSKVDESAAQPTPIAVINTLDLRPVLAHGHRVGMRVSAAGQTSASLAALGLHPGDVIVSVNGGPDGGASVQGDIMRSISEGEATTLAVQRQGDLMRLTINPSAAATAAKLYNTAESQ